MQARVVDLASRRARGRTKGCPHPDRSVVLTAHPGAVVVTVGETSVAFEPDQAKGLARDLVRLAKVAVKAGSKGAP